VKSLGAAALQHRYARCPPMRLPGISALYGLPVALSCLYARVDIPKHVTIHNARLGIALRVLQVCAVVYIGYTFTSTSPWQRSFMPVDYGVSIWREGVTSMLNNSNVPHCNVSKMPDYTYERTSSWAYAPQGCKRLQDDELYIRKPSYVFIPTFFTDKYSWTNPLHECTGGQEQRCTQMVGANFSRGLDKCQCIQRQSFFVQNPEEQTLGLSHGYVVQMIEQGHLFKRPKTSRGRSGRQKIMTVIQQQNGNEWEDCPIKVAPGVTKSEWTAAEAQGGIILPLTGLLKCAGTTLDSQSEDLRSGNPGETHAPHLRITGSQLLLTLKYQNWMIHDRDYDGIVCYLRVTLVTQWMAQSTVEHFQLPGSGRTQTASRSRYAYGITVAAQGTGSFGLWDPYSLMTMIVGTAVIIKFPAKIVYWISLYGAGMLSQIYSNAAEEKVDVYTDLAGVAMRMFTAVSSFRALTNQLDKFPGEKLEPMTSDDFKTYFTGILRTDARNNVLGEGEIDMLVKIAMKAVDYDKDGHASLGDFVRAVTSKENMNINELGQLFHIARKRGSMEQVFDNSPASMRTMRSQVALKRRTRVELFSPHP